MKDLLWLNISQLPYFRGLLRAVEGRFYQGIELSPPVLDLGCGDGHFAQSTFNQRIDLGLDPEFEALKETSRRNAFRLSVQANGADMPFPDNTFNSAYSNSVLEHIPGIQSVLDELGRVMSPGAYFYFCVPNHQFTSNLLGANLFRDLKLDSLAVRYEQLFNRISRHKHLDPPRVWEDRLTQSGFTVEEFWHYYSPAASHVTETGHLFGVPSLVCRKLTGSWILVPSRWNLYLTEKVTAKHYLQDQVRPDGVCTFYITRKIRS
jgi:SAM-dependent methyltransferase